MFKGANDSVFLYSISIYMSKLHFLSLLFSFFFFSRCKISAFYWLPSFRITLPHDFISFYHVTIIILSSIALTHSLKLLQVDVVVDSPFNPTSSTFREQSSTSIISEARESRWKLWLCFLAVRVGRGWRRRRRRNFSSLSALSRGDESDAMMKTRRELKHWKHFSSRRWRVFALGENWWWGISTKRMKMRKLREFIMVQMIF